MTIAFTVNGQNVAPDLPGDMPLLWVLRGHLQLTGTKYGCGRGLCGACTVHLNGSAVRACQVPLTAVRGASVTTIEGLDPDGLHPLQEQWRAHGVPQCGYCQSGQIMSAAALLATDADPDDRRIAVALSGNLCRCGTYQRILKAVKAAAQVMREAAHSR